jgi:ATP-dependent Clp protease adaptor protein ClpS
MGIELQISTTLETGVTTENKIKVQPPSLYHVLLLNDDYTPRDFVVEVLGKFFGMDETSALQTMLTAHLQGIAACGVFPREVAETKVEKIMGYLRETQYPLQFTSDKV